MLLDFFIDRPFAGIKMAKNSKTQSVPSRNTRFFPLFWVVLGIVFSVAVLAYHFFINLKCPFHPWWYEFDRNDDISGVNIAQTLALLNGGDLVFVDHPGATGYMFYGLYLRIMALVFSPCAIFLKLSSFILPQNNPDSSQGPTEPSGNI